MTRRIKLDQGWGFRRYDAGAEVEREVVEIPHNAFLADLDGRDHWTGECEYARRIDLPAWAEGETCSLYVGAAMHSLRAFVDGREIGQHEGGYLPFEIDLPATLRGSASCELTLRLDNRDNPDLPPGKPLADLDFCWYGGLYRGVELRVRPVLHITDAVSAGQVGGGGVFIRTLAAGETRAEVSVRTHVRNTSVVARAFRLRSVLTGPGGEVAAEHVQPGHVAAGGCVHVEQRMVIESPRLWSPASPALYGAVTAIETPDGELADSTDLRFGIRRVAFSRSGGFQVNGRRLRLRGTNRHQEYPRVGYAAPRAAQYRDARRIKEAGFDYVRLSHYPQSPDFLDACDELGLVVMNAIPGWQFIGGEKFCDACERNARELIRRDRNHPCVVLWELSLNETAMDEAFMERLHRAGHEEMPGDQMFTCGWIDRYDVFIHSRQHGQIHAWSNGDKALVVAEYGDWEFYASNEGFDQKTGSGLLPRWANSRHFRGGGERGLRQQACNHMIALNDTLASPAVLDGQWAVFDYARGYDPVRAAVGVMDMFRLPKFSYWFYRSQRDPGEGAPGWSGGAVVFIATYWTAASDMRVLVFSNCEEVELQLQGVSLGRVRPMRTSINEHLPHPPVLFEVSRFESGMLVASGFIGGECVASHRVSTPGAPSEIRMVFDDLGIERRTGESDVLIAHARIVDAAGTLCVEASTCIAFAAEGGIEVVGPSDVVAEAGIASVVLRIPAGVARGILHARDAAGALKPASIGYQAAGHAGV